MTAALRAVTKRMHHLLEVMLNCLRWHVSCPLSFRHLEELMAVGGVLVNDATLHCWTIKIVPLLARVFCRFKRPLARAGAWTRPSSRSTVNGSIFSGPLIAMAIPSIFCLE